MRPQSALAPAKEARRGLREAAATLAAASAASGGWSPGGLISLPQPRELQQSMRDAPAAPAATAAAPAPAAGITGPIPLPIALTVKVEGAVVVLPAGSQ